MRWVVAIHATLPVQHHGQATLEPEPREEPSRRTLDTRHEQVHSEVERHSEPGRDEVLSAAGSRPASDMRRRDARLVRGRS